MTTQTRCEWANSSEIETVYHDEEWGIPVHDDRKLFEMLVLESMQAGLSWSTILQKRETHRMAYDNFQAEIVANYSEEKVQELLQDPGVIRNKLKVRATINNAQRFLDIQKEFGSFDTFIWSFVDHTPIVNNLETISEVPSKTELSATISKDLKKRGFKFLGPTTIYSFMQSVGMVDDHLVTCFRK